MVTTVQNRAIIEEVAPLLCVYGSGSKQGCVPTKLDSINGVNYKGTNPYLKYNIITNDTMSGEMINETFTFNEFEVSQGADLSNFISAFFSHLNSKYGGIKDITFGSGGKGNFYWGMQDNIFPDSGMQFRIVGSEAVVETRKISLTLLQTDKTLDDVYNSLYDINTKSVSVSSCGVDDYIGV